MTLLIFFKFDNADRRNYFYKSFISDAPSPTRTDMN